MHIPDEVVAALWGLYTGLSAQVAVDRKLPESFDMDEGVSQGCPALPMAFGLHMDQVEEFIATNLQQAPMQLHNGTWFLDCMLQLLLFADGIVLL